MHTPWPKCFKHCSRFCKEHYNLQHSIIGMGSVWGGWSQKSHEDFCHCLTLYFQPPSILLPLSAQRTGAGLPKESAGLWQEGPWKERRWSAHLQVWQGRDSQQRLWGSQWWPGSTPEHNLAWYPPSLFPVWQCPDSDIRNSQMFQ